MNHRYALFLAMSTAALFAAQAQAADTPAVPAVRAAAPSASADKLAKARTLIDARQWAAATDELRHVNDTASADWNNLMGYTLRKGKTPDLEGSQRYYDAALKIDPHHRNTLEYSGELSLMKNDLGQAQARLATLAAECGASCSQYTDLKAAIERYQAAGNKFVATNW